MLNKEVCRKCIASRSATIIHAGKYAEESFFKTNWEHYHYVHCTPTAVAFIRNDTPDYCPYFLEHLINT
jgi:hypothetical protein